MSAQCRQYSWRYMTCNDVLNNENVIHFKHVHKSRELQQTTNYFTLLSTAARWEKNLHRKIEFNSSSWFHIQTTPPSLSLRNMRLFVAKLSCPFHSHRHTAKGEFFSKFYGTLKSHAWWWLCWGRTTGVKDGINLPFPSIIVEQTSNRLINHSISIIYHAGEKHEMEYNENNFISRKGFKRSTSPLCLGGMKGIIKLCQRSSSLSLLLSAARSSPVLSFTIHDAHLLGVFRAEKINFPHSLPSRVKLEFLFPIIVRLAGRIHTKSRIGKHQTSLDGRNCAFSSSSLPFFQTIFLPRFCSIYSMKSTSFTK